MDFGVARQDCDGPANTTATTVIGYRAVPFAGAGPRRDRRRPLRPLRDRLRAVRNALRHTAVHRPVGAGGGRPGTSGRRPGRRARSAADLPREIDAIVLKALSKNPLNRYQTAAEMRADLTQALAGRAVRATPVMSERRTRRTDEPVGGRGRRPPRRSRRARPWASARRRMTRRCSPRC